MKAFLLYKDRDSDIAVDSSGIDLHEIRHVRQSDSPRNTLPKTTADLIQDLELDTLFTVMSAGDVFLFECSKRVVLASLHDPVEIVYRQQILMDCMEHAATVRAIYQVAAEAVERERGIWGWTTATSPRGVLHRSVEVLQIFAELLKRLRHIADEYGARFHSEGFSRFFRMIATELGDEYTRNVEDHLRRLEFRHGVLMSAELSQGNKGANYILRKPLHENFSWTERVQKWMKSQFSGDRSSLVYEVDPRDEAGARALDDLRTQGIAHVAAALAQSTDHILGFFKMLRLELGFYLACLNLRDQLTKRRESVSFPDPLPASRPMLSAKGLYDVCLSLTMADRVVGNDVTADDKHLLMITGANRGGKSTFLRSVGLAQLMMQCGMFVPAEAYRANVSSGIFTHFKREEDVTMKSGKLDEELSRMSSIVEKLTPNSIVLFNESFASTNEREGSEIARQIVRALLESGIKVFYVTHLFDLASGFQLAKMDSALFLRAERLTDGTRTFRLAEGEPLPTSYGEDLYWRIFQGEDATAGSIPSH